jgi:hypothetical protein
MGGIQQGTIMNKIFTQHSTPFQDEASIMRTFQCQKFGLVFPVAHDPVAVERLIRCAHMAAMDAAPLRRAANSGDISALRMQVVDMMENPAFQDAFIAQFADKIAVIQDALQARDALDDLRAYDPAGHFARAMRCSPVH